MNYITDHATDHTTDCIITTEQLTKKYKNFTSVNNVSLHIRKGSIYGFLGPNGAGKSTTMKMLLGLTKPTSGSFTIDGKHFPADRLAILNRRPDRGQPLRRLRCRAPGSGSHPHAGPHH